MLADKDFINAERCRGDQFTNALNLYLEFFDEQLTPPIAEVIAEPETGVEPSIGTTIPTVSEIEMLLSEEVFSPLKIALAKENIRTIEELKALKLWAFMNQKNLYSISMRQTVLTKVRQLLEREIAENPELLYELHCGTVVYSGDTLAKTFILLFGMVHINVVNEFRHHAPGDFRYMSISPHYCQEVLHVHLLSLSLFQFQP